MKTYYKVETVSTGKNRGRSDEEYQTFDTKTDHFTCLEAAKQHLKVKYGNCKREKLFRDNPNNEPYQSGWIYCFNNSDMSHRPVDKWHQQDWVEVFRCESTIVLPDNLQ